MRTTMSVLIAGAVLAGCSFDLSAIAVRPDDAGPIDASPHEDTGMLDLSQSDLGPDPTDMDSGPTDLGPELADLGDQDMEPPPEMPCDLPWGGSIDSGADVTAFAAPAVTCGNMCLSETRICSNAVLSGSYTNEACAVGACSCTPPWGGSVANGADVTGYLTSSVACGDACSSETRTCTDGMLSGAFANASCVVAPCASCTLPWGGTIAHGTAVPAYSASSVACGASCATVAESRTCNDGALSGSFTNASCAPLACPCTLPWGGTIASGSTTSAYSSPSVACGGSCAAVSETRTCTNGTLSGSFASAACSVGACAPCTLPWGGSIASGTSTTAYSATSVACGSACASVAQTRTCTNGVLSGTYTNAACTVGSCACTLPWGGSVASGTAVTAYQASSVACGTTCASEARMCLGGVLSGTYTSAACTVAPCSSCVLPWGGTIANGASIPAYSASSVACGASCTTVSESRVCTNGTLSGSFTNASCAPAACPCTLPWGGTIPSGGTTTAYSAASVACGGSCAAVSETRTCTNGTLSGSYTSAACGVGACASCTLPWGGTIASGSSTTAYQAGAVACGSSCTSQTRTCTNGTLSGTYTNAACTVGSCSCTLPWGGTVTSGTGVTAYQASSVACGSTCTSQTRTCTSGTLSGTYTAQTCGVTPCAACTLPWGGSIADGASITVYSANSVACGASCTTIAQTRVCNNGTLSGSFASQACAPLPCPCTLPWGATVASGTNTTAYLASSVPCGDTCVSQARNCTNGVLSGSYANSACSAAACASCTLPWGGTLAHGMSVPAYAASSVICSSSCATGSELRACNNGVLSGSNSIGSCTVAPCSSCAYPWGGGTIPTGTSLTAYASSGTCGVTYCNPVIRTCTSGVLSGAGNYQTCGHIDCCGACCTLDEYCDRDDACCSLSCNTAMNTCD